MCKIDALVEHIMSLNDKESQEAKHIRTQIDILVYKSYNLSYDNILDFQPDFPITREEYENYEQVK